MTSSTDFLNMQLNLRNNQTELADFMSDLQTWEKDIKQKDQAIQSISTPDKLPADLKGEKATNSSQGSVPPVRHIATKGTNSKSKTNENSDTATCERDLRKDSEKKAEKIKSYDYRAWDKFDVDEACEQIESARTKSDKRNQEEDNEDEEAKVSALLKQREKQKASFYKEQGNKCLKNGKINDAIIYYTKGIEADPTNALLYSNRAMANLKLEKYDLVVEDCSESIKLDESYFKSYLRRASAYSNLEQVELSEADLKTVLKLQPDNKEALNELNKLKLVKENRSGIANTNNIVLPVKKPISKRSKVPLRRIQVEEVKSGVSLSSNLSSQAGFIRSKDTSQPSSKIQIIEDTSEGTTIKAKDAQPVRELESRDSDAIVNGHVESNEAAVTECPEKFPENEINFSHRLQTSNSSCEEPQKSIEATNYSPSYKLPSKPSTSMQFIADWRNIHKRPELVYAYVKQIEPQSLSTLIPHSAFDSAMLSVFLQVFKNHFLTEKDEDLFGYMSALCRIKRFSTLTMFLSKSEKQILSELFEFVQSLGTVPSHELNSVKKMYSMM